MKIILYIMIMTGLSACVGIDKYVLSGEYRLGAATGALIPIVINEDSNQRIEIIDENIFILDNSAFSVNRKLRQISVRDTSHILIRLSGKFEIESNKLTLMHDNGGVEVMTVLEGGRKLRVESSSMPGSGLDILRRFTYYAVNE